MTAGKPQPFQPPGLKSRGETNRQTNYGDRVYIGDGSQNPELGNVYPFDQAVRLVDVRTDEPGSWVVDLNSRIEISPEEGETVKVNRVTARVSMGTGGVSSVFDVDVYGCARLCLPCEALIVDVTAHDAGVPTSAGEGPPQVATLQTVEATCQRTWAHTNARISFPMLPFEGEDDTAVQRIPKYACKVQAWGARSAGSNVYNNATDYTVVSGTSPSTAQEIFSFSGAEMLASILQGAGTGLLLPPYADLVAVEFGGQMEIEVGDMWSFELVF